MLDHTNDTVKKMLFKDTNPSAETVAKYIDWEIKKLELNFLVVENLIEYQIDEPFDGNIRLLFQK
jgi:hypothetical protein